MKIKIKPSFFLLMIFVIALRQLEQFFILIMLVFLHELCHMITAAFYGAKCNEIIVTPAGLCAKIDIENLSLFQKLVVLFSGPVFNIVFGLLIGSLPSIALGIFNLLPVYPLDGGKITGYTMGYFFGTLRSNRYNVAISKIISLGLLALGIFQSALYFGNISLVIIAIFILKSNKNKRQIITYSYYKALIHKPNNKILKIRVIMANKNTSLKTIIYRLGTDYYTIIYIRDGDIIATVTEDNIQSFIINNGISYNLIDVFKNL